MIHLKIEDYCRDCEEFEAEVEKHDRVASHDTFISCAHACRCEQINNYLAKSMDKPKHVKCEKTCKTCVYMVCSGSECRKHDFCQDGCDHFDYKNDQCKCQQVKTYDICPHYKLDTSGGGSNA